MANLISGIVIISILGAIYYYFKGYFMIKVGNQYMYDGWGRKLYEAPTWIKIIWSDFQFPGYKWLLIDMGSFWLYIIVVVGLVKLSTYLREPPQREH